MSDKEILLSRVIDSKRKPTEKEPNLFDRLMEGVLERIPTYHPTLKQKLLLGVVGVATILGGVAKYYSDYLNPNSAPPTSVETTQKSKEEEWEEIIREGDIDRIAQDEELIKRIIRGLPYASSYASRK